MVNSPNRQQSAGMDQKLAFGLRLRAIRVQRDLTQEELASLIDRSTEAVSNLERGESLPSLETLVRLSQQLTIPLRELVDALDPNQSAEPKRQALEAALADAGRQLSLRDLEIAVKQIQAFPRVR